MIEEKGTKPTLLAGRANIGVSTIYKMIRGEPCEIELVKKVAAVLKVSYKALIIEQPQIAEGLLHQANAMGINLMLTVPTGQHDPGGELTSFATFMAQTFQEYSLYIEDSNREPRIQGFADFMSERRKEKRKEEDRKQIKDRDAWKQVRTYFITSFNEDEKKEMYFYAIANQSLHGQVMESLDKYGKIPDFAVIVASGYYPPSENVKAMMKACYGFDHDKYVKDDDLL